MKRAIAIGARGLLGLLVAAGLAGRSVQAVTFLWDGGGADDNWTTNANWNPDGAPVNDGTADVVFGGTLRTSPNTDVTYSILSLSYNNTAGSFTNGGSQLTIGTGGVTNNSTNAQTINNNIVLGTSLSFNAATGNLTFGGTIDNSGDLLTVTGSHNTTISGVISGAGGLSKTGTGTLILSGANTYGGGTTVSGGVLQGDTTSLQGAIHDNANVTFSQTISGTYSGVIDGSGSVTKEGSGTVIFSGANTYTGGTTVNAGTLQSGAANAFVNNTAYTVNGGTLDLNNHGLTMSSLSGTGGIVSLGSANLSVNQNSSTSYSGAITGTGTLSKSGTGTLILSGTNTYSGVTTVTAGTLQAGSANAFQTGNAFIVNGGTLDLNDFDVTMSSLSGTGGTVDLGSATLTLDQNTTQTYAGSIIGSGNIHDSGTGTMILTGTNSYTGTTTVDSGSTLQVGNGGTSGTLGTGDVHDAGALKFNRTDTLTVTNNIDGAGTLEQAGTGTTILTGTNSYGGTTTISAGTLQIGNGGTTGTLGTGTVSNAGALVINRSNAITVSNAISGAGSLTDSGTGTATLTGANTYMGATTINAGSTLDVGGGGVTGSLGNGTGAVHDNGTLILDRSDDVTIANSIDGTGGVTKTGGSNIVTLTGTNTYTGATVVGQGTLKLGSATAYPAASALTLGSATGNTSGTFDLNGNNATVTGLTTAGTGASNTVTNSNATAATLTFNGGTSTFSGTIQDGASSVALTESAGALTLSGANTYTGATNVNGGTLNVSGSTTSATTVGASGTLSFTDTGKITGAVTNNGATNGTGTIVGTLTNNGTLTPATAGATTGTLTVMGNYTNNSGSTVQIGVDNTPSNTNIDVSGTATLNGGTVMVDTSAGFLVNNKYHFLQAGTFVGDYSSVSAMTPNFILAQLGRDSNGEFVVLQSNFIAGAQTQNQRAVAAYLDAIAGNVSGDLQTIFTDLQGLSNAQAAAAFEAMSGDIHGTLGQLDIQSTTLSVQRIARHLRGGAFSPCGGPLVADDGSAQKPGQGSPIMLVGCNEDGSPEFADADCGGCVHWTAWTQGYGLGGSAKSDGNAPGVSYDMGGTVAGMERWIDDCHLVGFYGGYNGTNVQNDVSRVSSINGGQFGGYFMLNDGFSYYTLLGGFEFDGFATHRQMQFDDINRTADSDYSGWQSFWYIERGFTFQNCNRILQPFVALQYDYLRQNGFNETGANSIDLAGGGVTTNSLRSILGARLQYTMLTSSGRRFLPEMHALWMHEYLDSNTVVNAHFTPMPVGSPGFTVQGLDFGRDWALLGANFTWEMADGWSLFLNYDCQTNSQQTAHIGSGGLGCSW